MKNLIRVPASEVWEYWRDLEGRPATAPMRTDIIDETFPVDTVWFEAEVDQSDIDRLFMIRCLILQPLLQGLLKHPPGGGLFCRDVRRW